MFIRFQRYSNAEGGYCMHVSFHGYMWKIDPQSKYLDSTKIDFRSKYMELTEIDLTNQPVVD